MHCRKRVPLDYCGVYYLDDLGVFFVRLKKGDILIKKAECLHVGGFLVIECWIIVGTLLLSQFRRLILQFLKQLYDLSYVHL